MSMMKGLGSPVHKLRNLVATVPRSLRAAVVHDFQAITQATSPAAAHAAVARFRRTWSAKWSAVVVSLDEAGPVAEGAVVDAAAMARLMAR